MSWIEQAAIELREWMLTWRQLCAVGDAGFMGIK